MSDTAQGDSALTFSDNFSIDWRAVDYTPDDDHLAVVNESNEAFLRAVAALATYPGEHGEDEAFISQEIERLDLKVNLILDLVSQLLYRQLDIPEKTRVTISSDDLVWQAPEPPASGATVFVQAYVQHGTPKPLSFYAAVTTDAKDAAAGRCRVRYLGLSSSVRSWLEKLIFRHHRREVAYRRSRSAADQ